MRLLLGRLRHKLAPAQERVPPFYVNGASEVYGFFGLLPGDWEYIGEYYPSTDSWEVYDACNPDRGEHNRPAVGAMLHY